MTAVGTGPGVLPPAARCSVTDTPPSTPPSASARVARTAPLAGEITPRMVAAPVLTREGGHREDRPPSTREDPASLRQRAVNQRTVGGGFSWTPVGGDSWP